MATNFQDLQSRFDRTGSLGGGIGYEIYPNAGPTESINTGTGGAADTATRTPAFNFGNVNMNDPASVLAANKAAASGGGAYNPLTGQWGAGGQYAPNFAAARTSGIPRGASPFDMGNTLTNPVFTGALGPQGGDIPTTQQNLGQVLGGFGLPTSGWSQQGGQLYNPAFGASSFPLATALRSPQNFINMLRGNLNNAANYNAGPPSRAADQAFIRNMVTGGGQHQYTAGPWAQAFRPQGRPFSSNWNFPGQGGTFPGQGQAFQRQAQPQAPAATNPNVQNMVFDNGGGGYGYGGWGGGGMSGWGGNPYLSLLMAMGAGGGYGGYNGPMDYIGQMLNAIGGYRGGLGGMQQLPTLNPWMNSNAMWYPRSA